jgi:hypothetical protein
MPRAELVEQSTLVDLLQESRAQGIRHLENWPEHRSVKASARGHDWFISGPS